MTFQIIFSIIGIIIGLLIIIYNRKLVDFFGRNMWAEEHLGPTGTYTLFKFIGIALLIIALLILTGDLFRIIKSITGFIKTIMGLK